MRYAIISASWHLWADTRQNLQTRHDQVGSRLAVTQEMERALGALRDLTRRDILLRFYADQKPRSVDDVARAAGIHRSVAFEHLERLVALGYLETERRRGLPGKPAKIYRLAAGPVQISHPMRRYDVIAEALANALQSQGDSGRAAARSAGRELGLKLAQGQTRSMLAAIEPLADMGGEYEVEKGVRIDCTNCLFAEVCRRTPIICSFHAGLLEGLLERSGFEVTVESIGFQGPYGCAFNVHVPGSIPVRQDRAS
jgi:predicted ArsR family transcriptional regulator